MQREDRRVRRTRRRLREALVTLVLEKGYDNITIQEITERADMSRATFYLHFNNKDELLASSLEAMFDELVDSVRDTIFTGMRDPDDPSPPSLPAFRHVADYSNLYRALLGNHGVTSVISRTIHYLGRLTVKQCQLFLEAHDVEEPLIPVEINAQYLAGSLFALLVWWVENDLPHSPEEMAQMYHRMTVPTMYAMISREFAFADVSD